MNPKVKSVLRNARKKYLEVSKKVSNKLKKKQPFIKKGRFGIKYFINPLSALDDHIIQYGVIGDWLAVQTDRLVPENGIIFDIGANIGLLTTVFAKRYVPNGKVYAYEPDLQNVSQLKVNIDINHFNHVYILPIALQSDPKCQQATLHIRRTIDGDGKENRGLSSLLELPVYEVEKQLVLSSTLDKEVKRMGVNRIDFIKIDVEGAEYEVLAGGEKSITEFHPVIQYEYSNELDKMMSTHNTADCFFFIKKLGYRQYALENEKRLREMKKPNADMEDVNVICFWGDTCPFLQK